MNLLCSKNFIYRHCNLNSHNFHMSQNILLFDFFQPFKNAKTILSHCSQIWPIGQSMPTPDLGTSGLQSPMKRQSFLITSKFIWCWKGISMLFQPVFQKLRGAGFSRPHQTAPFQSLQLFSTQEGKHWANTNIKHTSVAPRHSQDHSTVCCGLQMHRS